VALPLLLLLPPELPHQARQQAGEAGCRALLQLLLLVVWLAPDDSSSNSQWQGPQGQEALGAGCCLQSQPVPQISTPCLLVMGHLVTQRSC
jgi:hypothetical protein